MRSAALISWARASFSLTLMLLAARGPWAYAAETALSPEAAATFLARFPLPADLVAQEVVAEVLRRLPRLELNTTDPQAWAAEAHELRARLLDEVVLRGAARDWAQAAVRAETLDRVATGPGYSVTRARLEVVPGMWIPALWYLPDPLPAHRAPAVLHVNGHERTGKATGYKQVLSINLARRGLVVLDLEWFGMGQLATEGFSHYRLNQLDLCGTSGLAPFYLALRRGLDALAARPEVDSARLAVTGLSGGGWQSILIAALDTRVALAHPVAGYASIRSNVRYGDFGDSEQAPADFGRLADYAHLTALVAPRWLLLTYNASDDCCFQADHSLPPLVAAAEPVYRLLGQPHRLRTHVNDDPGTHNYERDNREAFYEALGEAFYPGDEAFPRAELPGDDQVRSAEELEVPLPADNRDFHDLAVSLADELAAGRGRSLSRATSEQGDAAVRERLRARLAAEGGDAVAARLDHERVGPVDVSWWRLRLADRWTIPVVRFTPDGSTKTSVLVCERGTATLNAELARRVAAGDDVICADLFSWGTAAVRAQDPAVTYALALDCVGRRPLGLLVDELAAVGRWASATAHRQPVTLATWGPRSGLVGRVATILGDAPWGDFTPTESLPRLRSVIDDNLAADDGPELFCFGLLAEFDFDSAATAPKSTSR